MIQDPHNKPEYVHISEPMKKLNPKGKVFTPDEWKAHVEKIVKKREEEDE